MYVPEGKPEVGDDKEPLRATVFYHVVQVSPHGPVHASACCLQHQWCAEPVSRQPSGASGVRSRPGQRPGVSCLLCPVTSARPPATGRAACAHVAHPSSVLEAPLGTGVPARSACAHHGRPQ